MLDATFRGKRGEIKKEVERCANAVKRRAKQTVRVDTGELRNSIDYKIVRFGFGAQVGSDVKHAFFQEYGKAGNYSYTPYLRPSFEAERQRFIGNIKRIYR